uniref:CaMBD domain-containing protein n=1 Tax=Caenorhabditis tropicalis TaxID=1561998 RepID=A0A1I7UR46_9PELO
MKTKILSEEKTLEDTPPLSIEKWRKIQRNWSSFRSDWDSRDSGNGDRARQSRPSVYGKRYGVAMDNAETVRQRYKTRRRLSDLKVKLCDVTLILAVSGLILAMLDVEFTATRILDKYVNIENLSFILRTTAIVTTIALLFFLIFYHFIDIKIQLVETGTSNWRVGITSERVLNTLLEVAICAICPIPETGFVSWPQLSNIAEKTRQYVNIPISVLLTLPMFLRFFIVCRYMVLHSSQHQDTATRTIASLNHIAVDFRFVLKSEMYERPLFVLSIASILFWCIVSWMLTQCERYAYPTISGFNTLLTIFGLRLL